MSHQEYISLVCVDEAENKWRSYTIQVTENTVLCAWGRLNRYNRKLKRRFNDKAEMMKYLVSVLKRRNRHGYKIIEKSEEFPELEILKDIPVTNNIAGQLRLF